MIYDSALPLASADGGFLVSFSFAVRKVRDKSARENGEGGGRGGKAENFSLLYE